MMRLTERMMLASLRDSENYGKKVMASPAEAKIHNNGS